MQEGSKGQKSPVSAAQVVSENSEDTKLSEKKRSTQTLSGCTVINKGQTNKGQVSRPQRHVGYQQYLQEETDVFCVPPVCLVILYLSHTLSLHSGNLLMLWYNCHY